MPPTKVAILLPDLRGGGAERVCIHLSNAFVACGLAVDMVLMRAEGELLPQLDPRVRVIELGTKRVRHLLRPLMRYLSESQPAALLANMWPLTVLAVLARRMSGYSGRIVTVEHIAWSSCHVARKWSTRMAVKTTMRWLLPKADAVLAVSRGAAEDMTRFAGLPEGLVRAQYNPVTFGKQTLSTELPIGVEHWSQGPHKRLLAVGEFKEQKDFPTLIAAVAILKDRLPVRLLILGKGDGRPHLEELILRHGLQGVVFLPGFFPDPKPFFARADLFVLSSEYEGFGNVVAEALEQGTPVVSTDCPSGPREILEDGKYGALVAVGDIDAMAMAMQQSLQSTHDTDALKARARDFAIDKIADQYLDHLLPKWRARTSKGGQ